MYGAVACMARVRLCFLFNTSWNYNRFTLERVCLLSQVGVRLQARVGRRAVVRKSQNTLTRAVAPYVLYGVKYIDLVPLTLCTGDSDRQEGGL